MNPQPENAKTERSFDDVLADCDWTAHPETLLSNANVLSVNTQAGRQNCPEVPLSAVRIFRTSVCCSGGNIVVLVLATLRAWGTLPGSHWINGSFLVKLADASMRYLRFRFSALKYMS